MKRLLAVLAAAVVAAIVLLHPVPPPAASTASGWSPGGGAASSAARHGGSPAGDGAGGLGRRTPPPHPMVYVAGEVVHPGVYAVGPESRVRDALALAGGSKPGADLIAVNLAAHVRDGDEIVVPARGAVETPPTARASRGHGRGHRAGGPRRAGSARNKRSRRDEPPPAGQVDLNSADAETLASVPGIGPGLAERIVAFREANGPFAAVDELLDVSGITDRRLDAILPYVVAR